jgi:hypothetical protein
MSMKFINLTPHEIKIIANGNTISFPPSGTEARIKASTVLVDTIDNVPIYATKYSEVTGLPQEEDGTKLIVSFMVKDRSPSRTDLLSPSSLIRDDKGVVIGCQGLSI